MQEEIKRLQEEIVDQEKIILALTNRVRELEKEKQGIKQDARSVINSLKRRISQ